MVKIPHFYLEEENVDVFFYIGKVREGAHINFVVEPIIFIDEKQISKLVSFQEAMYSIAYMGTSFDVDAIYVSLDSALNDVINTMNVLGLTDRIHENIKQLLRIITPKTMDIIIPDNIMQSFIQISKNHPREYGIAVDFEKGMDQPQTIKIHQGGETSVKKIDDYEFIGHTHPQDSYPAPSFADIYQMHFLKPEFIIAGKTGNVFVLNMEDVVRYYDWKSNKAKTILEDFKKTGVLDVERYSGTLPIDPITILVSIEGGDKTSKQMLDEFFGSQKGKDLFFDETGVRIYEYRKGMVIKMLDDPVVEKLPI